MSHFVTIRLEYANGGKTPWKRRGRCTCGWQCLSWDGLRPILMADEHVQEASYCGCYRRDLPGHSVYCPLFTR